LRCLLTYTENDWFKDSVFQISYNKSSGAIPVRTDVIPTIFVTRKLKDHNVLMCDVYVLYIHINICGNLARMYSHVYYIMIIGGKRAQKGSVCGITIYYKFIIEVVSLYIMVITYTNTLQSNTVITRYALTHYYVNREMILIFNPFIILYVCT